jgi:four helix bundle protein
MAVVFDRSIFSKTIMRNFKQLRVWQKGFDIARQSYQLVQTFPKKERFALSIQITRAAVSIPSNIAEGSSRSSEKDYHRFIEISLGSAFELETHLLLAEAVNFGQKDIRDSLLMDILDAQKMLGGFIARLSKY